MEKSNVGRAILGFLISFLMVCLLMADGLLIGLKTTILKGTDIVDVLKNANTFGMVSEILAWELEAAMGDEPVMQEIMKSVLTEDMLTELTTEMTQALASGKEVDLTEVAQECIGVFESTSNEVIDQAFDEVAANEEITVETLMQSGLLQAYEQELGMEFAPWVEEYVSGTYGDASIKVDAKEVEVLKNELKATLNEEIMPSLKEEMEHYIEDINTVVNQELQTVNEEYHIDEIVRTIETILDILQFAIIVLTLIVVLLIVVEILLVYRKAMNCGVRNVGVSAIFAGLVIAIVGLVISIAHSFLMSLIGIAGVSQELFVGTVMKFVENNLQKTGIGFLVVAAVYLVVAVICFVLSSYMKKRKIKI